MRRYLPTLWQPATALTTGLLVLTLAVIGLQTGSVVEAVESPPTHTIAGHVLNGSRPIPPGKVIMIQQMTAMVYATGINTTAGAFTKEVPPAVYDLRTEVDGYYPATATGVDVRSGSVLTVSLDLGADAYSITGSVSFSGTVGAQHVEPNVPQREIKFRPVNETHAPIGWVRPISPTGSYTAHVPAGRWYVEAPRVDGWLTPRPQIVAVGPLTQTAGNVNFVYIPARMIYGTITTNGVPVTNTHDHPPIQVLAQPALMAMGDRYSTGIDAGGRYTLTVRPGVYDVTALNVNGYFPAPTTVDVRSNNRRLDIDLAELDTTQLSGWIMGLPDPTETTVIATPDGVMGALSAWVVPHIATDTSYTIFVPPPARPTTYRLKATPVHGYITPRPLYATLTPTTTSVSDLDFVFVPANKTVRGTVCLAVGDDEDEHEGEPEAGCEPVDNAIVTIFRRDGSGEQSTRTDGDGQYSLTVGPGDWLLRVAPDPEDPDPGWFWGQPPVSIHFVDDRQPETRIVDLTVYRTRGLISGKVVEPDGTTPAEGEVRAIGRDGFTVDEDLNEDGTFDLEVPLGSGGSPATYRITVIPDDHRFMAPPIPLVTVDSVITQVIVQPYPIVLEMRDRHITGQVTSRADSTGVPGIKVIASGAGTWARASTDAHGYYTLTVSPGVWWVHIANDPGSGWMSATPAVRTDTTEEDQVVDLEVISTNATIAGEIIDPAGNWLYTTWGTAFARPVDQQGAAGVAATFSGGQFHLIVPGDLDYIVGAELAPVQGYMTYHSRRVSVPAGATVPVTITAYPISSTIQGTLRDKTTGRAITTTTTGVRAGTVLVGNGVGGWATVPIEPLTGRYSVQVPAGTWYVNLKVNPTTGYVAEPGARYAVTTFAGSTATVDVLAVPIVAEVHGQVFDPSGTPLPAAWVAASTPVVISGTHTTVNEFVAGRATDNQGNYRIGLPAGQFTLRVSAPTDVDHEWLAPPPATISLTAGMSVTQNLTFTQSTQTISGAARTANGATMPYVFVTAWSDAGQHTRTYQTALQSPSATLPYTLNVTSGRWHLSAVSMITRTVYRTLSPVAVVVTSTNRTRDLVLVPDTTLPSGVTVSFDASEGAKLMLGNGADITNSVEVSIPPRAMGDSGLITVVATPIGELPAARGLQPFGIGYTFLAQDENGRPITRFNLPVSIILHYTEAQLRRAHITAANLVPHYWNPDTGSWQPVSNAVLDEINRTLTISTDHFTDYAMMASSNSWCLTADADTSGTVDATDLMLFAQNWRSQAGDGQYDPFYDLNLNNEVDIADIQQAAGQWQQRCSQ